MKIQTIWFLSLLIFTTIIMQVAFFYFTWEVTDEYPLGRVPDNYFHYMQVVLDDNTSGFKYFGTHMIFRALKPIMHPLWAFNIIIPIMFAFMLPLGVFFMSREYFQDTNLGILAAILFTYGTDAVATIFQIAVWPQGWNMVLTCFSIGFGIKYLRKRKKRYLGIMLFLIVWSAAAHLQFAMMSFAIILIFLIARRRYMETFTITLCTVFFLFQVRRLYTLNVITNEFYVNPAMMIFSIFPLNAILIFYGLWLARLRKDHWKNLMLFAPACACGFFLFVDPNYRLYMNMYMFLSPFMALALMKIVTQMASLISGGPWNYNRLIWAKRGLMASYLGVMFVFFLMFNVYVSYAAVMGQNHGEEEMTQEMNKYYPPPTLDKYLQVKRTEIAAKTVEDYCLKYDEVCGNGAQNGSISNK